MILDPVSRPKPSLTIRPNCRPIIQEPLRDYLTEEATHGVHQTNAPIVIACCFIPLLVKGHKEHAIKLDRIPILHERVEQQRKDLPLTPRAVALQKLDRVRGQRTRLP